MGMDHPEVCGSDHHMEATVGEQLRLGQFVAALEGMREDELRELCRMMAEQVMVTYPAAIRYLAHEAARNLGGAMWDEKRSDELLSLLINDRA